MYIIFNLYFDTCYLLLKVYVSSVQCFLTAGCSCMNDLVKCYKGVLNNNMTYIEKSNFIYFSCVCIRFDEFCSFFNK